MTLVLVDRDALEQLIQGDYANREEIAIEGGCASLWDADWRFLDPDDVLVTLAVQAGLQVPGPLKGPPPAPPMINDTLSNRCAQTFRHPNDRRLRCAEDGKVVYTSSGQAEHAAQRISSRQPMRSYLGRCGHYHVSRNKHHAD
jgi:hypothetical protein